MKKVLLTKVNRESSGESAQSLSLARAFAVRSHDTGNSRGRLRHRAGDLTPLDGCTCRFEITLTRLR